MSNVLERLKQEAKEYYAANRPSFYEHLSAELAYSRQVFFDHPLVRRCSEDVLPFLNDGFGHGIEHSKKVSIEAGSIILAERFGRDQRQARHLVVLAQLAGLLHDICRLEPEHAQEGAHLSRKILYDFPLSDADKEMVVFAIQNHEAFKPCKSAPDEITGLLSDALYDADKFRWGPDNFVTTLWEICDYQEWPLEKIVERFPQGLEFIQSIADTFRTETGRIFGPEFIQTGLAVGRSLYRRMCQLCD
jgi:hypothetical protein